MSQVAVHLMNKNEVSIAVEWAITEGWNPGLHDAESFYAADHQGFLVAKINGIPIGCISAVRYSDTFGFLGFYIVRPDFRGQGIGLQLWNAALKRLGQRTIGLDGVLTQQDNYQKSGFQLAHRNIRFEATVTHTKDSVEVMDLRHLAFDDLIDYDRPLFPVPRRTFLRAWIHQPDGMASAVLLDNKIVGYALRRPCIDGYKIGPLMADTVSVAETLLQAQMQALPTGTKIFVDVPEPNRVALELVARYGMQPVFETVRMYTQNVPDINLNKVFGVTSFELG